jgi:GH24 family phage-related lysozyme (muramidase)
VDFEELENRIMEVSKLQNLARGALLGTTLGAATLGAATLGNIKHVPPQQQTVSLPGSFRSFLTNSEPETPRPDIKSPEMQSADPTTGVQSDVEPYSNYIAGNEGYRTKVYNDGRGNLTIGIGHWITPEDKVLFKKLFGNVVDYDAIRSGRQSLSKEQVYVLFDYDLRKHIVRSKRVFPRFDDYPLYIRTALVDAIFRGDMGRETIRLINLGNWDAAAKEYTRRYDYQNRKKLGISGIGPRMQRNQQAMLRFAQELRS